MTHKFSIGDIVKHKARAHKDNLKAYYMITDHKDGELYMAYSLYDGTIYPFYYDYIDQYYKLAA